MFNALVSQLSVAVITAADTISMKPNDSFPGVKAIEKFGGGLMLLCLLAAAIGILAGGLISVVGPKAGHHGAGAAGKSMVVNSIFLAVGVGCVVALVLFFYALGQQVK